MSVVELQGERPTRVGPHGDYRGATLTCTIRCASGDHYTGRWRGVPVDSVVLAMDPPPDTTHLVFEGRDGYRAVASLTDALRGIVAFERLDAPGVKVPRFVAPGVDGGKLVGPVRCVEAVAVGRTEDPLEVADADA